MAATSYKDAGVDINAGEELIKRIKPAVKATFGPEVATDLGLFGGAFRLDTEGIEEPLLIASTDGVGTKTMVADWTGRHDTVGKDLINHCVNDIFTCGARPLFFMDYYATGKLNVDIGAEVLKGLAEGCRELGVALLGGETAEMPSVYHDDVYDLAGTIVGIVDKKNLITGEKIREGDILIGLESSGLHTNGYSLARKVLIDNAKLDPNEILSGMDIPIGEALLAVHRCYQPAVSRWLSRGLRAHGMAHITGGGIEGNVSRIIPDGLQAVIEWDRWQAPPLFQHIMELGEVPPAEMARTFNLGIGWVIAVSPEQSKDVILHGMSAGIPVYRIGYVDKVE
ncbi:phosphoribosylformylglycinamidine cyclo-ligase [bacterium]|nr:phosphoribosylformylglycinamidine cyclo-ligase [bacterium]